MEKMFEGIPFDDILARADFYERFEVWIKLLIIGFITFFFISQRIMTPIVLSR